MDDRRRPFRAALGFADLGRLPCGPLTVAPVSVRRALGLWAGLSNGYESNSGLKDRPCLPCRTPQLVAVNSRGRAKQPARRPLLVRAGLRSVLILTLTLGTAPY